MSRSRSFIAVLFKIPKYPPIQAVISLESFLVFVPAVRFRSEEELAK